MSGTVNLDWPIRFPVQLGLLGELLSGTAFFVRVIVSLLLSRSDFTALIAHLVAIDHICRQFGLFCPLFEEIGMSFSCHMECIFFSQRVLQHAVVE